MKYRDKLKALSEKYHGEIHLLVGLTVGLVVNIFFESDLVTLLIVSSIAAFLPDMDHLFYLFIYGRNSVYATEAREILLSKGPVKYIQYCKKNHKNNTGIKSHNLLVVLVFGVFSFIFWENGNAIWAAFFLSSTFHFIFDMFEDILFFGKLNGNWLLRFGMIRE